METVAQNVLVLAAQAGDQKAFEALVGAYRRAEREARYQQVVALREQGLTSKQIADRLMMHERTVRHWLKRQVAPDVRQRRKYASDFDPYASSVLKRWQQGCHNGLLMRDYLKKVNPFKDQFLQKTLVIPNRILKLYIDDMREAS